MKGKVLDGEYALTVDPSSTWPSIEFYFDGFYLSVPASVYFFKVQDGSRPLWVFGFTSASQSVILHTLISYIVFFIW